jgi:hypothetical protein
MADEIRQVDYHYTIVNSSAETAVILDALSGSGIGLLAFSAFPRDDGTSQLDLIPEDSEALGRVAGKMGLSLSERKAGFLISGEYRAGVMVEMLRSLAEAHVNVTSVQAVSAGFHRFGALLWVRPRDVGKAAAVLGVPSAENEALSGVVDESSEESFPASDPPSWAA